MRSAAHCGLAAMALVWMWAGSPSSAANGHDTAAPAVKAVMLKDVHPLYGGQNLYLRQDGSGFAQLVVAQATPPELHERRFRLSPAPAFMVKLAEVVRDHDFLGLALHDRPGIPNEAQTTISIELTSGRSRRVSQWANDRHPGFEAVYQLLRRRAQESGRGQPIYEGRHQPDWVPEA